MLLDHRPINTYEDGMSECEGSPRLIFHVLAEFVEAYNLPRHFLKLKCLWICMLGFKNIKKNQ